MITQRYIVNAEEPEEVEPAQFVFKDNDSDEITGFIYDVNDNEIEIVLFEMKDLSYMKNDIISYTKEEQNWALLLIEAVSKNPDMKEHWEKIFDIQNISKPTIH